MLDAHWYMERDLHSSAEAAVVERMKAKKESRRESKNIMRERTEGL